MHLAMGIVFLFLGCGCLYLASHDLQATTPYGAFQTVLTKMREA